MITHALDLAPVNKIDILDLLAFRQEVAERLYETRS